MSYFPKTIMPLTPKEKSPRGSSTNDRLRELASDYNKHDVELQSIEKYLGAMESYPKTGVKPGGVGSPGGVVVQETQSAMEQVNGLVSCDGVCSSSGYCVAAGENKTFIHFPGQAHCSPLAATPGPTDTTIQLLSSKGFPKGGGVVSILNKAEAGSSFVTMVEWIRYGSIEGDNLVNCQRGILGTTVGDHSPSTSSNIPDAYPGWNNRTRYFINPWQVSGSFFHVKGVVQETSPGFSLDSSDSSQKLIADAAASVSLLPLGSTHITSQDPTSAANGVLTPDEAMSLMGAMETNGAMTVSVYQLAAMAPVMVFAGKMSVSYSVAMVSDSGPLSSMKIIQNPDASLSIVTTKGA